MKQWRIARTILMFIVVVVTFVAGFISFKHGDATDKLIFVTYAISCVLGLPTLLKDMSKEYTGKPEPKRFVRNRFVAYAIASAALSLGTFWLITLTADNVALLSESLGGSHRWWIAILLAIYWVLFMAIELFMFYLPQRLGYEDEYDTEKEESKANKESIIIGGVAVAFVVPLIMTVAPMMPSPDASVTVPRVSLSLGEATSEA
jgi:hypothetical protein